MSFRPEYEQIEFEWDLACERGSRAEPTDDVKRKSGFERVQTPERTVRSYIGVAVSFSPKLGTLIDAVTIDVHVSGLERVAAIARAGLSDPVWFCSGSCGA